MALSGVTITNGAAIPITPPTGGTGGATTESVVLLGYGTFVGNGTAAITVADPGTTLNSVIIPSLHTVGGSVGALPTVTTITAGTGFTITCTASDTSTYNYLRIG